MSETDVTTLRKIKIELHKMDPALSEDDDAFKAGVVLLSSLQVGPNVQKLARFTGYRISLIAKFGFNLRVSGVWRDDKIYASWFDKNGGASFWMDIGVALGWLKRVETS